MADLHVRSDSVDVEQIMRQIRARIREKRGVDYTETELQQLANVKLEKFLDPRGLRSDLVQQFRKHRVVSGEPPKYEFEDTTLYDTHRGSLRFIRKMLHPILKLFLNPNPLIHAMHVQAQVNEEFHRRFRQREEMDPLFYEVIHNLVLEVTRLGIEVHNLKMRVESLSSRLDFDERRARSLEGAVQYRPAQQPRRESQPQPAATSEQTTSATNQESRPTSGRPEGPRPETRPDGPRPDGSRPDAGQRRRRRRRRRRPGQTMADQNAQGSGSFSAGNGGAAPPPDNVERGGDDDSDDGTPDQ
jgi:hypothetical protein